MFSTERPFSLLFDGNSRNFFKLLVTKTFANGYFTEEYFTVIALCNNGGTEQRVFAYTAGNNIAQWAADKYVKYYAIEDGKKAGGKKSRQTGIA